MKEIDEEIINAIKKVGCPISKEHKVDVLSLHADSYKAKCITCKNELGIMNSWTAGIK